MQIEWQRTELRQTRPFFSVAHLNNALDNAELQVRNRSYSFRTEIPMDQLELNNAQIEVKPNLELDHVRDTLQENTSKYSLLLAVRNPMLKKRKVLDHWCLSAAVPKLISFSNYDMKNFMTSNELDVTLAIVLNQKTAFHPGWPHQIGSWVAKETFRFRHKVNKSTFDLRPMNREQAKDRTEWSGALVHVDSDGIYIEQEIEDESSPITAYIAEEVYNALMLQPKSALHEIILCEILYQVLEKSKEDILKTNSVGRNSLLEGILRNLKISIAKLQELLNRGERSDSLRALIQDRVALVTRLGKL